MLFFYSSNIVIMNDYSVNNLSETLRQGIKFKKGQTKIINKTEKKNGKPSRIGIYYRKIW